MRLATRGMMSDIVALLTRKHQYSRSCCAFRISSSSEYGPQSARVKAAVDKNLAVPPVSCCFWIASSLMDYFKVSPSIPFSPFSVFYCVDRERAGAPAKLIL